MTDNVIEGERGPEALTFADNPYVYGARASRPLTE